MLRVGAGQVGVAPGNGDWAGFAAIAGRFCVYGVQIKIQCPFKSILRCDNLLLGQQTQDRLHILVTALHCLGLRHLLRLRTNNDLSEDVRAFVPAVIPVKCLSGEGGGVCSGREVIDLPDLQRLLVEDDVHRKQRVRIGPVRCRRRKDQCGHQQN